MKKGLKNIQSPTVNGWKKVQKGSSWGSEAIIKNWDLYFSEGFFGRFIYRVFQRSHIHPPNSKMNRNEKNTEIRVQWIREGPLSVKKFWPVWELRGLLGRAILKLQMGRYILWYISGKLFSKQWIWCK